MRISIRIKVFSVITSILVIFSAIFLLITNFFSFDFFLLDYKENAKRYHEFIISESQKAPDYLSFLKQIKLEGPIVTSVFDPNQKLVSSSAPGVIKSGRMPKEQKDFIRKFINDEVEYEFFVHTRDTYKEDAFEEDVNPYKSTSLILIGKLPQDYFILIERPLGSIGEAINMSHHAILLTGFIAFAISILVSYFFSYLLTKPIYVIRKVANSITKLEFQDKVIIPNNDEIGDLGQDINNISEKLELTITDLQSINQLLKKDKDQLLSLNTKLEKASETDTLTQLSNRLRIDRVLDSLAAGFKEQGNVFSVILMDIDHFKKVNDNYGHPVGDSVLKQVSGILKQSSRANDEVGRWGGEEFILILAGTPLEGAKIKAENIRKSIEKFEFDTVKKVTCSLGVSEYKPGDDLKSLMKRTDDGLYRAKQNGRNQLVAD